VDYQGGRPTDEQVEMAHRILRADYWNDVRDAAEGLIADHMTGQIESRDQALEALDEACGNHQRVIYTGQAMDCLGYSESADAYFDQYGADGSVTDEGVEWTRLALFAFRVDVARQLDAMGFSLDDEGAWGSAEDEEDDPGYDEEEVDRRIDERKLGRE